MADLRSVTGLSTATCRVEKVNAEERVVSGLVRRIKALPLAASTAGIIRNPAAGGVQRHPVAVSNEENPEAQGSAGFGSGERCQRMVPERVSGTVCSNWSDPLRVPPRLGSKTPAEILFPAARGTEKLTPVPSPSPPTTLQAPSFETATLRYPVEKGGAGEGGGPRGEESRCADLQVGRGRRC